jgi:hypothetical protein
MQPLTRIPLSQQNLEAGIRFWRSEKTHWPSDFHNRLYGDLARWRARGLTECWWDEIVPLLSAWKANRPRSAAFIRERGSGLLPRLNDAYEELLRSAALQPLEFAELRWQAVRDLYHLAHSIKGVVPPVFASKLCHFILPAAYPVIDGDAVGLQFDGYQPYWTACQGAWAACQERGALVEVLRRAIGTPPASEYPWGPKITELCLIGSKTAQSRGYDVGL